MEQDAREAIAFLAFMPPGIPKRAEYLRVFTGMYEEVIEGRADPYHDYMEQVNEMFIREQEEFMSPARNAFNMAVYCAYIAGMMVLSGNKEGFEKYMTMARGWHDMGMMRNLDNRGFANG